jgi:hypothetical protein
MRNGDTWVSQKQTQKKREQESKKNKRRLFLANVRRGLYAARIHRSPRQLHRQRILIIAYLYGLSKTQIRSMGIRVPYASHT